MMEVQHFGSFFLDALFSDLKSHTGRPWVEAGAGDRVMASPEATTGADDFKKVEE